jgi:hypothetical protein
VPDEEMTFRFTSCRCAAMLATNAMQLAATAGYNRFGLSLLS